MIQTQQVKITTIPLSLSINTNIGILNFLSQAPSFKFQHPQIQIKKNTQQITYRNAVGKEQDSDSQEEQKKKKILQLNQITIKSKQLKRKYFKVNIPINKTGVFSRNRDKIHFLLQFGHDNKGQLTVIDDLYDCQMEIENRDRVENSMTFEQKIKMQNKKLDARIRQPTVSVMTPKDYLKKNK